MHYQHSHHKILYGGIAGALLLIGSAVFYYLVIFLPHQADLKAHQEQAALQLQQQAADQQRQQAADAAAAAQQAKANRALDLQACLLSNSGPSTSAHLNWVTACADGGNSKGPNCDLPPANDANFVNSSWTQAKDYCFKQYPQN